MEKKPCSSEDPVVRKGPWTVEEDLILMNYIAKHGEGVWDSLAKAAGKVVLIFRIHIYIAKLTLARS